LTKIPNSPGAAAGCGDEAALPPYLGWLLATSCGLIVANIYYAQPLAGPISAALGLPLRAAGLIVTMTQVGYGLGLLLVVPLGDLVENRRLAVSLIAGAALALAGAAVSTGAAAFLAAAFLIGIGSVAVQVLVPYAAHLVPAAVRGRVVGDIMSGLMLGIMLARPVASLIADALSWHAVFALSATVMIGLALVLRAVMPPRWPGPGLGYGGLLASMVGLARSTRVLRRHAFYHACLFGAFSLFWTTVPLLLADTFRLSQFGIAMFALAGVAGAIAAPIAGRVADRGWSRPATGLAILAVGGAFLLARGGAGGTPGLLGVLVAAAILLDFGVTTNLVLGQRAIFALGAAYRSRLNGLYMATFFAGGALGSAIGGWTYAHGGWSLACWAGLGLPVIALAYYATALRAPPPGTA
jgi:predicted MFS family arabinose efflux permease